jgi:hypothetical protein
MNEAGATGGEVGALDAIARDLASGQISRRTALKRFAGASLGAMLPGALFAESAFGACPKSRRCHGKCCPKHAHCHDGICKCNKGFRRCGKHCRNLLTDEKNCGSCGHICPEGKVCKNGKCTSLCASGYTYCDGVCTNLQVDADNCGACGTVCDDGYSCVNGACYLDCPTGETDCSGVCVNLQTDENNCGSCGHACQVGEVCDPGVCTT